MQVKSMLKKQTGKQRKEEKIMSSLNETYWTNIIDKLLTFMFNM